MWKLLSMILLALAAIVSAIEVGEDNGDRILLNVPLVKQWGSTFCAAASGESLLRYLGLSAIDLLHIRHDIWRPEHTALPMQSMMLNAMQWNHLFAIRANNWRSAINDILARNFDTHGGSYQVAYYDRRTTLDPTLRTELRTRIYRMIRTSLRYNMPVALGMATTSRRQNGTLGNSIEGHLVLINGMEGRDPESPVTLYGVMDPAVPSFYGMTVEEIFFTPIREGSLIYYNPHGSTSLPERRSLSDVGYSLGQSYMRNNFDCPQFRRPRSIYQTCPTKDHPFWKASADELRSYNLPNGTAVCDLVLDKLTASGILYQRTEQSIQEYMTELLVSIKWVSVTSSKARDVSNVLNYINKNFNYFIYKVIKLVQSESTYQFIRITADNGEYNFNPRKNIYLLNEDKTKDDIEYDLGEELIREKFDCYDNDKIIGDRNEFRKRRSALTCPTVDHPYWENEDNLHSYYYESGVGVCEVQLNKLTALGIVYQKEGTLSEYLDKVIKGITWTSELNEKNHDSDAKDLHDYIKKYIEYFRYKFYELTTTNLSYTSIKVRINCESTTLNPEEAMYLL